LNQARRSQISSWHPDKHNNDPIKLSEATEKAKRINIAYDELLKYRYSNPIPEINKKNESKKSESTSQNKKSNLKNNFSNFPENIEEITVESSMLDSIGYDEENQILYLTFNSNYQTYRYKEVPIDKFRSLLNADSIGKYVHKHIFPFYANF
jgi:DnaJ-class molecular chaperone